MAQNRVYEDFQPPHDWARDERSDTLILPLEGFSRSQLKVQITSTHNIRLSGERQIEGNIWRRFYMEFPLPQDSDTNDIGAKFERGTLHVRFPKLTASAVMPPQLSPPPTQQALPPPSPPPPPPPPKPTTREEPKAEEAIEKKPETKKDETKMEQQEKEPPKEYKKKEDKDQRCWRCCCLCNKVKYSGSHFFVFKDFSLSLILCRTIEPYIIKNSLGTFHNWFTRFVGSTFTLKLTSKGKAFFSENYPVLMALFLLKFLSSLTSLFAPLSQMHKRKLVPHLLILLFDSGASLLVIVIISRPFL